MVHSYINPFDFRKIFVDYFLGTTELTIFAIMILISWACASYNMSNKIFLIILAMSSLIFAGILGQAIYILIIFIIGLVSFKAIATIVT